MNGIAFRPTTWLVFGVCLLMGMETQAQRRNVGEVQERVDTLSTNVAELQTVQEQHHYLLRDDLRQQTKDLREEAQRLQGVSERTLRALQEAEAAMTRQNWTRDQAPVAAAPPVGGEDPAVFSSAQAGSPVRPGQVAAPPVGGEDPAVFSSAQAGSPVRAGQVAAPSGPDAPPQPVAQGAQPRRVETRQIETSQAETRQIETSQADNRPVEIRQTEIRQTETRQTEIRQTETRPGATTPGQARPFESAPVPRDRPIDQNSERYIEQMYRAATSAYLRNRFGEAVEHFTSVIVTQPGHNKAQESLFWRSECHRRQGNHAMAVTDLRAFINQTRDHPLLSKALYHAARSLEAQGRDADAATYRERLLAEFPETAEARRIRQEARPVGAAPTPAYRIGR